MSPIHVVWWTGHPEVAARPFWDQAIVVDLLERSRHRIEIHDTLDDVPAGRGAVVCVAGRFQDGDATRLNEAIGSLPWAVVVVTSDEEATFPTEDLRHPAMRLWVQYPRPGRHDDTRRLPLGPTTDTWRLIEHHDVADTRPLDWYFAGQVTHHRRVNAARAIVGHENGLLVASSRFAGGLDQDTYLRCLASAKVVLAPCGPVSPDSFRLWETLEAGGLPLVDARASHYDPAEPYWPWLLGQEPPFPVIEDWDTIGDVVNDALAGWPHNANRAAAWWQLTKRRLARQLDADIADLSGTAPDLAHVGDQITVIVTTSPIPSHPGTDIIDETIRSIRRQPELARSEILVAADGVPPTVAHRADVYGHYLRRLIWRCAHGAHRVTPIYTGEWRHQALTVRAALDHVDTPYVLFVEHDTPLTGRIDWPSIVAALASRQVELVRFHHEHAIPGEHRYLMLDDAPVDVAGVPLVRTAQWSQRPHLARTDTYRRLFDQYFASDARTMIEDCLHGVMANAYDWHGVDGWTRTCRMAIYHPAGSIQRSTHLDGRAGDPKGEMIYAYPGGVTPEGAPRATADRGHP